MNPIYLEDYLPLAEEHPEFKEFAERATSSFLLSDDYFLGFATPARCIFYSKTKVEHSVEFFFFIDENVHFTNIRVDSTFRSNKLNELQNNLEKREEHIKTIDINVDKDKSVFEETKVSFQVFNKRDKDTIIRGLTQKEANSKFAQGIIQEYKIETKFFNFHYEMLKAIVKKNFDVEIDKESFEYLISKYPHHFVNNSKKVFTSKNRHIYHLLEFSGEKIFLDLLSFDKNGKITQDAKDLFELNFAF